MGQAQTGEGTGDGTGYRRTGGGGGGGGSVRAGGGACNGGVTVPEWVSGAFFCGERADFHLCLLRGRVQPRKPASTRHRAVYQTVAGTATAGPGERRGLDTDFLRSWAEHSGGGRRLRGPAQLHSEYVSLRYGAGWGWPCAGRAAAHLRRRLHRPERGRRARLAVRASAPATGCRESDLAASEGDVDGGPAFSPRFAEPSVPGAVPIINLSLGLDSGSPRARPGGPPEGGVYDAFFSGAGLQLHLLARRELANEPRYFRGTLPQRFPLTGPRAGDAGAGAAAVGDPDDQVRLVVAAAQHRQDGFGDVGVAALEPEALRVMSQPVLNVA